MRPTRKLTPIGTAGDGKTVCDALCQMFIRCAQLTRRRPSRIGLAIAPASMQVIVALEDYFYDKATAEETAQYIDQIFDWDRGVT